MNQTLALIGTAAFTIASLIVGLRLALLARKTRQLPETLIAISFLSAGFGSNALSLAWSFLDVPDAWTLTVALLLRALIAIGGVCVAAVTWRVFHLDAAWAKALFFLCFSLYLVYVVGRWLVGSIATADLVHSPLFYLESLAMLLPYTWIAWESFRERTMLLRRQQLGIDVEPGLPRRLLLWGIGMGAIALLFFVLRVSPVMSQLLDIRLPTGAMIAVCGMTCAVCLWLAFFPPASWRRERRSV